MQTWWLFRFIITFYFYLIIEGLPFMENELNNNTVQQIQMEREDEYCPTEFFSDLSLAPKNGTNDSLFYRTGDFFIVRCDAQGQWWESDLENSPEKYTVYPDSTLQCQSDGTWSGSRPICVNVEHNIRTASIAVNSTAIIDCQSSSGINACSGEWTETGVMHKQCFLMASDRFSPTTNNHSSVDHHSFVFKFNQKFYFSFLLFNSAASKRLANVAVHVKKHDVIAAFSIEARNFLEGHYDSWNKLQARNEPECPVVQLAVFTEQLKLTFSVAQQAKTREPSFDPETIYPAGIKFYHILRQKSITEGNVMANNSCPKLPEIPNATFSQVTKTVTESARYDCWPSYTAVDPITGHWSPSFTLRCVDGDWIPYPFPICRKQSELTYDVSRARRQEEVARQDIENRPLNNEVEASNFRYLLETCYWFTIGLFASLTVILFVLFGKFKNNLSSLLLPSCLNTSPAIYSGVQAENSTNLISTSEACCTPHNRERPLLSDIDAFSNNDGYHIYQYLELDGVKRIELVSVK